MTAAGERPPSDQPSAPAELPPTEMAAMLDRGPFTTIVIEWDGTMRWVSENIRDVIGLPAEQLVGEDVFGLLHPDDAVRARVAVEAMTTIHLRTRGMVYRLRSRSGSYEPCLVAAQPHDVDGHSFVQVAIMTTPMRLSVGEALQSVVRGASLAESLGEIERIVTRTLAGALFGLLFVEPETGQRRLLGSVPLALAGLRDDGGLDDRPGLPWTLARATGATQIVDDPTRLPDDVATAAASLGQHTVVVTPVPDDGSGEPTLIIGWVPVPQVALAVERGFEDAVAPIVELVLDRQHHLAQVRWAAEHDPLTTLCNRSHFYDRVTQTMEEAGAGSLAVLYLDLDGFKSINDEHGHAVGDHVLRAVASRMSSAALPAGAFVGRLGGDEFAIALPGALAGDAQVVAQDLLAAISAPIGLPADAVRAGAPPTVAVGVSIGIAASDCATADDLVDIADAALLDAKRAGKGVWRLGVSADRRMATRRAEPG